MVLQIKLFSHVFQILFVFKLSRPELDFIIERFTLIVNPNICWPY